MSGHGRIEHEFSPVSGPYRSERRRPWLCLHCGAEPWVSGEILMSRMTEQAAKYAQWAHCSKRAALLRRQEVRARREGNGL